MSLLASSSSLESTRDFFCVGASQRILSVVGGEVEYVRVCGGGKVEYVSVCGGGEVEYVGYMVR